MVAVPPSERVVRKLSEAKGVDEERIEPLYNSVDPDALDAIFRDLSDGPKRGGGRVEFTHEGCDVTVRADGGVSVDE
jgi:hypothetical protein